MVHRLIRVSEPAYRRLAPSAGVLQARLRHRVSLSDALDYLLHKKAGKARLFLKQMRERRHLLGRGPRRASLRLLRTARRPPSVHTSKN